MQARVIEVLQSLIGLMVRKSNPKDIQLKQIVLIIQDLSSKFQNLTYFHVLCNNNKEVE